MLKFQGNAYSFSYKILINGTLITFLKVKQAQMCTIDAIECFNSLNALTV